MAAPAPEPPDVLIRFNAVANAPDAFLIAFNGAVLLSPATEVAPIKLFPADSTLPASTLPVTLNDPSVPTVVKLEIKTLEFSVLPVNVPAGATTALVLAAVNCPC